MWNDVFLSFIKCNVITRREIPSEYLWRIHRGNMGRFPQISCRGQSGKRPPTFWAYHDATTGFTSQSLGLPANACTTGSFTAIEWAPRMHQNLPFWAQNLNSFWRGGIALSPERSLGGEGAPLLTPSPLAPLAPRSLCSPWFVPPLF